MTPKVVQTTLWGLCLGLCMGLCHTDYALGAMHDPKSRVDEGADPEHGLDASVERHGPRAMYDPNSHTDYALGVDAGADSEHGLDASVETAAARNIGRLPRARCEATGFVQHGMRHGPQVGCRVAASCVVRGDGCGTEHRSAAACSARCTGFVQHAADVGLMCEVTAAARNIGRLPRAARDARDSCNTPLMSERGMDAARSGRLPRGRLVQGAR
jgi:hypothetical protein